MDLEHDTNFQLGMALQRLLDARGVAATTRLLDALTDAFVAFRDSPDRGMLR